MEESKKNISSAATDQAGILLHHDLAVFNKIMAKVQEIAKKPNKTVEFIGLLSFIVKINKLADNPSSFMFNPIQKYLDTHPSALATIPIIFKQALKVNELFPGYQIPLLLPQQ